MLEITLNFDQPAFETAIDSFVGNDLQAALVEAINFTAERVQAAVKASMLTAFDNPVAHTIGGVKIFKATPRADGDAPSAMVFLLDDVAGYLKLEQTGGVRQAGAPGTTRLAPLVPGPAAALDGFGKLRRTFVTESLQDPHVLWVTLRPREPPALVRAVPGSPL